MALKAIDFFCGIGGVTRGFLNKGIDVIAGIDIDVSCKDTYEANNIRPNGEPVKFFANDIINFDLTKVTSLLNPNDKLILIGCAPCQPFTKITQNLQGRNKERGLLQCFGEIILKLKPEYLFLENVQGLNSPANKLVLDAFLHSLKPQYNITPQIVNAMNYGVPQSRKRVILFAKRKSEIEFPEYTHADENGKRNVKILSEIIGNLPKIKAGEQHPYLKNHVTAKLDEINIKRLKLQKKPGDGMETWSKDLWLDSRRKRDYIGHKDVYSRLWWDRPAGTLTTKFVSISNGRFAHPTQNRGLSILEGLLIQTFPGSYKLLNKNLRIRAKQIGNAVPVKLAEAFAKKILDIESKPNK